MADLNTLSKITSSYQKTLKEISFDKTNEVYLCNDEQNVYCDFDSYVKDQFPSKQPASPDTLMFIEDTIFMVEFKNQKPADIDPENIRTKLEKGKAVLLDLLRNCNIAQKDYKFVFCVVHKNNERRWQQGIAKNTIQFGLEKYKNVLFDEIFTNDIDWFKNQYKKYFQVNC